MNCPISDFKKNLCNWSFFYFSSIIFKMHQFHNFKTIFSLFLVWYGLWCAFVDAFWSVGSLGLSYCIPNLMCRFQTSSEAWVMKEMRRKTEVTCAGVTSEGHRVKGNRKGVSGIFHYFFLFVFFSFHFLFLFCRKLRLLHAPKRIKHPFWNWHVFYVCIRH